VTCSIVCLNLVKLTTFGLLSQSQTISHQSFFAYKSKLLTLQNFDAPCRIRTCNRLIRSQVLYPVEPRVLLKVKSIAIPSDAEDRNRTGTKVTLRRILSPVRLPVPPPRLTSSISERRGSNPRPPPWQGDVLPLNYFRISIYSINAGYMI
jgi:hypothetical protein